MVAAAAINVLRQLGLSMVALMFAAAGAHAQDLEPRSYANTPVGLNFLIAGYGYTEGNVAFDPSVPVTDANLHTNSTVLAYARSLGVWGRSAKFGVVLALYLALGKRAGCGSAEGALGVRIR
jgi:hypothetical protein